MKGVTRKIAYILIHLMLIVKNDIPSVFHPNCHDSSQPAAELLFTANP